jgi:asparagine synthase (glutamine-hydrolysing)
MCGINGFIVPKNAEFDIAHRINVMNTSISHRGPDDSGATIFNISDTFVGALGQARLSIIDLSVRGHQPMYYTHGFGASNERYESRSSWEYSIVFNGEIYNYQEIRLELQSLGYNFSTESDTEVILASYHAWGKDAVKKWNGMWALCLFDLAKNEIFCSRDRFGKKPLYYFQNDHNYIFSSEIKGILAHEELRINVSENINPRAIDFYLTGGYIPSPFSIYKNIEKLEAGTNMIIHIGKESIRKEIYRYYEIPEFTPESNRDLLIQT